MQGFDLAVFLAVFLEMMGTILWVLVALAVVGLAGFLAVVWCERTVVSRRLLRAEVIGVIGGFAALALMAYVTVSGFTDAGGPVDWLLIGIIWGMGLVGTTILAYAAMGLWDMARGRCVARRAR
ncbi:DUF5368 domain-containing protein [Roseospira goensis]|uniref:Drug/metabolite transporter (DMT)-like permease n=1 Tax=Roseospira goensis TaxID=391922 RepID=A0A7W6RZ72_9PROT|nr:DUF5368 domain-containing protein [Roseospira goensis]MBB4285309.1 drug/metabolite transporter (DMT)-like permease [Roseospira goensis]